MDAASEPVAVIIDLVRSRQIESRPAVQQQVEDAFRLVNERTAPSQPIQPTIGDEFQGVFLNVAAALEATLLARLALPDGTDCRFGLGQGELWMVGEGIAGRLQDGPGWWRAREAIDEAHVRENGRNPTLRSWFRSESGVDEPLVNAYLLTRDQIISSMSDRARRVTLGTALGRTQSELAAVENVTQSAISQALRGSGGSSLLSSLEALVGATTGGDKTSGDKTSGDKTSGGRV